MRRLAFAVALVIASVAAAVAQSTVTVIGPITPGDCPQFSSTTVVKDSGFSCNGAAGGPAGGVLSGTYPNPGFSTAVNSALTQTINRLLIGTGGFGFTSIVLGGDCTFTSPNITCTKLNGVSFGSSPSTDTVPVVTAANTTTYTALPNCTTGVLQYSTTTHLFSCGATGAGSVTSVAGAGLAVASPAPITNTGTITVTAASKSDEQTGTSATVATTPSQQQQHDSAVKAWVRFTGSGTNGAQTINASYNVTSVTRTSTGDYTVAFTVPFASASFVCHVTHEATTVNLFGQMASLTTGASVPIVFETTASGNPTADPNFGHVVCFGRQ